MSGSDPFRNTVANICGGLPGADVSDPWGGGHEARKVGGKLFAVVGAMTPGVAVKCPDVETATMLKEAGAAAHAPYFHKSWVLLAPDTDPDELAARIGRSYDLIRAKLPVATRKMLPARSIPDAKTEAA